MIKERSLWLIPRSNKLLTTKLAEKAKPTVNEGRGKRIDGEGTKRSRRQGGFSFPSQLFPMKFLPIF